MHSTRQKTALAAALAALTLTANAAAGVLKVGATASDHATIAAAVAAAVDGDVVLVASGTYAGFTLDGRGIAVVADQGASVHVTSSVVVKNIAVHQDVLLSGLDVVANSASALVSLDVLGSLRVQGSRFGVSPDLSFAPVPGALVVNARDAAFAEVVIQGGAPMQSNALAGAGLDVRDSHLALAQCTIDGGAGAPGIHGTQAPGTAGGNAVVVSAGELAAASCVLRGGPGGQGGVQATSFLGCASQRVLDGGAGGSALVVEDGANVQLRATSVFGASGGLGGTNACGSHGFTGATGPDIVGTAVVVTETARVLRTNRVAREGTSVRCLCTGEPGDRVYLLAAWDSGAAWRSTPLGSLWMETPLPRRLQIGTVPASGSFVGGFLAPELGPSIAGAQLHLQTFTLDASGQSHLGGASVFLVLDRAQ